MKEMKTLPAFSDVIDLLKCEKMPLLPAEFHGYLCGVICGDTSAAGGNAVQIVMDMLEEEEMSTDLNRELLAQLMVLTFRQLQDLNFSFQLLLPEDEQSLRMRCEALTKWCQSFLSGLGIAGIKETQIKTAKLSEALQDLATIAQAVFNEDALESETENSYIELVEYVRTAVMLIFTENVQGKEKMTTQSSSLLH